MSIATNLFTGTLASGINSSATSIVVSVGATSLAEANQFIPSAVSAATPMFFTIIPKTGNANKLTSEIVAVSAITADSTTFNLTLTATRAQKGTTAKSFDEGCAIANASYSDEALFLDEPGSAISPSPWVGSSEIVDGAVTTQKLADNAVDNTKINWTTIDHTRITYVPSGAGEGEGGWYLQIMPGLYYFFYQFVTSQSFGANGWGEIFRTVALPPALSGGLCNQVSFFMKAGDNAITGNGQPTFDNDDNPGVYYTWTNRYSSAVNTTIWARCSFFVVKN